MFKNLFKRKRNFKRELNEEIGREKFVPRIPTDMSLLEIGPFYSPVFKGDNVYYFDVIDRDAMIIRAKDLGLGDVNPPDIHYVSPYGDLRSIDRKFSNAFSSHCIEHQPDLIRHLQDVGNLLELEGNYYVIAPDKRYCFDHFLPESILSDVICAYAERRTRHTYGNLLRQASMVTHNIPKRHWSGDHADAGFFESIGPRAAKASEDFRNVDRYIDCHAWQFTPESFRRICQSLYDQELTNLCPVEVYSTPRDRFEFTAVLTKLR